jgi:hypothetical protein
MSGKPKGQWGGKRDYQPGRPKETLSQNQVKLMLETAEKYAKETGKTIDDILLMILYAKDTVTRDRLAAIKLFKDKTMANISEGGISDVALGPTLFLPETQPDPALKLVSNQ